MGKLTEKQMMDILGNMKIIIDTREKRWEHIENFLILEGIKYEVRMMKTGDYTCVFPNYPELDLDEKILIEKKNSLSELAGNFTKNRKRFVNEFERVKADQKIHLLVETATWRKLFNGSYRSQFHPNSYKASILTWVARYNCNFWFCEKKESPEIIYKILYYEIYERLKNIS